MPPELETSWIMVMCGPHGAWPEHGAVHCACYLSCAPVVEDILAPCFSQFSPVGPVGGCSRPPLIRGPLEFVNEPLPHEPPQSPLTCRLSQLSDSLSRDHTPKIPIHARSSYHPFPSSCIPPRLQVARPGSICGRQGVLVGQSLLHSGSMAHQRY